MNVFNGPKTKSRMILEENSNRKDLCDLRIFHGPFVVKGIMISHIVVRQDMIKCIFPCQRKTYKLALKETRQLIVKNMFMQTKMIEYPFTYNVTSTMQ